MRGSKVRFVSAIGLAVLCAAVVSWAGRDAHGQPVAPQPPGAKKGDKDKDKAKDDRPARDENLPIGLPYERDAKQQLKAARDYLDFKEIPWNTVCPLLQNILDAKSDSFFDVEYKVDGETKYHRISVKTEANRIIAAFPKEGLQFYQQSYGQSAATLLDDAVKANYDLAMLADLSQRYFHTKAGADGTALLASIHLERGNYLEAAYAFERLLGRPNSDDVMTARNLFKAALAFKRSGDPKHAAMYKTVWDKLEKATRRDGLKVGTRTYTTDQLKAEADREVTLVKALATVGEWAMRLGNPARNATTDGGAPFLDPAFKPVPMLYSADDEANSWIKGQLEALFDRESTAKKYKGQPLPGFFPLTTHELVIYRSYNGVYAFASRDHVFSGKLVRAGEIRWFSPSVFGAHQLMTTGQYKDVNARQRATEWWADYLQRGGGNLLFENPLLGTLAHDGQNVYMIDDVAILPPPPVAAEFGPVNPTVAQGGELADALRASKLVALNIQTGKVSWYIGRPDTWSESGKPPPPPPQRLTEEEADKTTSAFSLCVDAVFLGAPLPLNGRLYALIEQAGAIRLLCLDPRVMVPVPGRPERVPTLVWSQKLGKPNASLGQFSDRRFRGTFLAASEGIMVCPTNSGAVIGVDLMSRSLLWAHAYAKVEPAPRPEYDPNTGRPKPPPLPVNRWRSSAPIIANGRVVFTAYDSNYLECLDLRTGKLLWTVRREETDLYVGGVVNDKVLVVGKEDIRAYGLAGEDEKTQTPKLAWDKVRIAPVTGHGVPGKGVFYVPVRQDGAGKDTTAAAEIWSVTVENGQIHGKAVARKRTDTTELARYGLGNLVFQDGMVFAQSPYEVACYPQLEQKKAEMNARLAANPNDPLGLTDRGELLLDDGKLKEAIADFKAAEKNNPPTGLERRIRDKLYIAFTELLRADFAAGEPFLKEYETLCEVPLDTEDPDEKVRRVNETLERKRTFLNLLAKGREKQGRLGEAFDHYLALAQLGVDKLQPDPDDANVKMRSDVIARGRIEGMIRRADPAARKSLETRVDKQWEQVKAGTDLPRLREFVAVFGPYFAAGAQAQFQLAELLLRTNNDADVREAQTHLAQIRVTAADPTVRARATEALARLMVKNGLMEDAVGLYLQLGRDYPDVAVRDGKTGADFLTDLLTDKRLLPYLEPARFPLPSRVKAEDRFTQNNTGIVATAFEVEPEGELLPMFRRLRFVIDVSGGAGNGTWTLRAFDRATGNERCRFSDLQPIYSNNPASIPFSKFVQASGQMLLVQLGPWVYGLDLAEKKERWRKNLLGDNVPVNQNQQVDAGVDGEVVVKYPDGITLTLGRSAVLQPGYVALLTRDGLKVVDPIDGRTDLWIRKGMPEQARLYGDARYIVMVEVGVDRKPVSTKVFRAIDGLLLDGAPDLGRTLTAARSYRIIGRNVLLTEGEEGQPLVLRLLDLTTGANVWKKEFDPKAVPLRALQPTWTGCVQPDGAVEVLDVATGASAGTFRIDADRLDPHVKGCAEAQLFADPERFYVVLDRDPSSVPRRTNMYNFSVRCQRVNGPMYCFDRGTRERLWYVEDVLDDQYLIVEQFGDIPVVMAANAKIDPTTRAYVFRVVVIEKDRGLLRLNKPLSNNNNNQAFQSLTVDLKNGVVEVQRYDLRVIISRDDEPKQAPER